MYIDYYTHYLFLFIFYLLFIVFYIVDVYVVVGDAELEEGPVDFVVGNGGKNIRGKILLEFLEIDFCHILS